MIWRAAAIFLWLVAHGARRLRRCGRCLYFDAAGASYGACQREGFVARTRLPCGDFVFRGWR